MAVLSRFVRAAAVLSGLAVAGFGCGDDVAAVPDAAPDAPGPQPQGSVATGELVVNEVSARPAEGPDWIELVNRSAEALDLCNYFVTDSLDRLDHYHGLGGVLPPDPCTETLLAPGAYLIVYADDDPAAGPDHAPFKLSRADEAHVVTSTGLSVDSLLFLHPTGEDGNSLARWPDSEGLFVVSVPTPGAPNQAVTP